MNHKEEVNHPSHYLKDSGFEVIDVVNAWDLNFQLSNAIKYVARAGKKDPKKVIQDLEKAIWYIKYEIDRININKNISKLKKEENKYEDKN
tara:strand:+ start:486 stop:758 length:273 start_codon:yes stop_codon:yes gene_type:complete